MIRRAAHLLATIDDNNGASAAVNAGSKRPKAPHSRAVRAEGDDKGYARNAHVHHGRREVGGGGTPAHHGPARAEPHAEEPERKPSNSAPSSHEASREPGRGREATSPTEIPARGWKDIFWRVYEEINKDRILAVAAGVTFYGLLGLFPALAALVSIYGLFADPATIQDHLNLLSGVLPGGALDIIGEQVKRITSKGSGTLGFTFFSGLAISLWSANAGVKAVFDALNVAYGEEEKRGFIALNLRSLAFTLGMIVFALVAIGAIVVVPVLLNFIGLGTVTEWIISLARWPVLLGAIVLVLAVLYRYGPSRDTAQWRWISAGSLVAAVVWVAASMLFSWYVANFGTDGAGRRMVGRAGQAGAGARWPTTQRPPSASLRPSLKAGVPHSC